MDKNKFLFLLILLIVVPSVYAIDFTFDNVNYQINETVNISFENCSENSLLTYLITSEDVIYHVNQFNYFNEFNSSYFKIDPDFVNNKEYIFRAGCDSETLEKTFCVGDCSPIVVPPSGGSPGGGSGSSGSSREEVIEDRGPSRKFFSGEEEQEIEDPDAGDLNLNQEGYGEGLDVDEEKSKAWIWIVIIIIIILLIMSFVVYYLHKKGKLKFLDKLFDKFKKKNHNVNTNSDVDNYVKAARKKGLKDHEIKHNLIEAGWKIDIVDKSLRNK